MKTIDRRTMILSWLVVLGLGGCGQAEFETIEKDDAAAVGGDQTAGDQVTVGDDPTGDKSNDGADNSADEDGDDSGFDDGNADGDEDNEPQPSACRAYLDLVCKTPDEMRWGPQEEYADENLNQLELEGQALYQTYWRNSTFQRSCSDRTNFTQTKWTEVDASKANWELATFFEAELTQSRFVFANLSFVNFSNTKLVDLSFGEACLKAADFSEAEFFGRLDFSQVIAPESKFSQIYFSATVNFQEADLRAASFQGSIFDLPVSFAKANLRQANFQGAEIAAAMDFSGADLSGAIWVDGRQCAEGSIGECL
jgi:uncharacterized protein YjbI with pentapeptide repeats